MAASANEPGGSRGDSQAKTIRKKIAERFPQKDLRDMHEDDIIRAMRSFRDDCKYMEKTEEEVLPNRNAVTSQAERDAMYMVLKSLAPDSSISERERQHMQAFKHLRRNTESLADIDSGKPLADEPDEDSFHNSLRRVQTYDMDHYGRGELDVMTCRPFYQDYRHYKYYGFAGKGAKTSWAMNRKGSVLSTYDPKKKLYKDEQEEGVPVKHGSIDLEFVVNNHRPDEKPTLTPARQKLLAEFSGHGIGRDPSQKRLDSRSGIASLRSALKRSGLD